MNRWRRAVVSEHCGAVPKFECMIRPGEPMQEIFLGLRQDETPPRGTPRLIRCAKHALGPVPEALPPLEASDPYVPGLRVAKPSEVAPVDFKAAAAGRDE